MPAPKKEKDSAEGGDSEAAVLEYQQLLQQLQAFSIQLNQAAVEDAEVSAALKGIDSAKGQVYALSGSILVPRDHEELKKELSEKKESLSARKKFLESQVEALKKRAEGLAKKIRA